MRLHRQLFVAQIDTFVLGAPGILLKRETLWGNGQKWSYRTISRVATILFAFCCVGIQIQSQAETQSIVEPILVERTSVTDFGADASGVRDSSSAFRLSIAASKGKVYVPLGQYRLDRMVILSTHMEIASGTLIFRSKQSESSEPIFWLSESFSKLEGNSRNVHIVSENSSPEGIIKIGHRDINDTGRNVLSCEVSNLTLRGSSSQKNTTGVFIFNSQKIGDKRTASYFHSLNNLVIQSVNTGIHLSRAANANSISSIVLFEVGDSVFGQAILIEGAMENKIYDVIHHHSKNSTFLRLIAVNDKKELLPIYNYVYGSVATQGGPHALCADIAAGSHNVIQLICNANLGYKLGVDFYDNRNMLLQ